MTCAHYGLFGRFRFWPAAVPQQPAHSRRGAARSRRGASSRASVQREGSTTRARWSVPVRRRKRASVAVKSRETSTWSIWAPMTEVREGQLGGAVVAGEAGRVAQAGVQDVPERRVVLGGVEVAGEDRGGPGAGGGEGAQPAEFAAPQADPVRQRGHGVGELEAYGVAAHVGDGAGHAHRAGDARGGGQGKRLRTSEPPGAVLLDGPAVRVGGPDGAVQGWPGSGTRTPARRRRRGAGRAGPGRGRGCRGRTRRWR